MLDSNVRCYRRGRVIVDAARGRVITLSGAGTQALEELRGGTTTSPAALGLGRRLVDAGLAHSRPVPTSVPRSVTIVVPVRDRPEMLTALLETLGTTHPVIVVSDGSADPGQLIRICASHEARILVRPESGGPAAARNAALPLLSTDLIAFVDSDCLPSAGWIERLSVHFEDPVVVAVAPRVRPLGPVVSVRQRYLFARCPLDLGPTEAAVGPGRRVSYVPSAAVLIRREAFAEGFDEALRCGEDVDAVWRLHDAGGSVRYDPEVIVEHQEPASWCAVLARRRHYGMSAAPLAERHPGRLAPVVLRRLPTASMLALLAGRPRLALAVTGVAAARLGREVGPTGVPLVRVGEWAGRGVLQTTVTTGRAATMLAAPGVFAALGSRRLRRPALVLLLAPPLADWLARRPPLDPVRWSVASIADDIAYGTGVWAGCLRERMFAPLVPAGLDTARGRPRLFASRRVALDAARRLARRTVPSPDKPPDRPSR